MARTNVKPLAAITFDGQNDKQKLINTLHGVYGLDERYVNYI